MKFNLKTYQLSRSKKYLTEHSLLILSYNANQNSFNWLSVEQGLHKLNFKYYKNYNNTTIKMIEKTIFRNFLQMISSTFFLLRTEQINNKFLTNKILLVKNLQDVQFNIHSLKLNNKIYSITQLKKINSLRYDDSIKIFHQFLNTHFKCCYIFTNQKQ